MKNSIFTPDLISGNKERIELCGPITNFCGSLNPGEYILNKRKLGIHEQTSSMSMEEGEAIQNLGEKLAEEVKKNIIADFEKSAEYCERNNDPERDLMVHVSTFHIIDDIIYMTYYANTGNDQEEASMQEARFAFCPKDNISDMTIMRVQKVGDSIEDKTIDMLYDTIMLYKGGDEIYILWVASADGMYYRFYRTYSISKRIFSPIYPNRFKVGETINDFSISGMKNAFARERIAHKSFFSDIGIMQKLTSREENGEIYYYTGAYSGYFNCIIKSKDFITWEYVSAPDFINHSKWENAVYLLNDKVYYFVRQDDLYSMYGFLTYYDLNTNTWATPFIIRDSQSRSDFITYNGELYLIHSPIDRNGFGIVKINTEDISESKAVAVVDMQDSLFYPFTDVYGEDVYISYTIDRKHIRLSKFDAEKYLK